MRFDLRAPEGGAPIGELYATALEMASWAETRGAVAVVLTEHHAQADGYLPSPVVMATAVAARTSQVQIMVAVIVLPFYEPVRLAEDMVVLDILSGGRVIYVAGIGYRPEEYEHHGVDFARRGAIADEHLEVLLAAKTGEPFVHRGRHIHITPAPFTPGGPKVAWGGGSVAAARRAGRFGIELFAQGGDYRAIKDAYADAAREAGREPQACFVPRNDLPATLFVADDLDAAWAELGPYLLHDARSYAAINEGNRVMASLSRAATVEELRAEERSHRIVTVDEAVEMMRVGFPLTLHPLVGGLPPDIAWRYLRTVTDEVVPRL